MRLSRLACLVLLLALAPATPGCASLAPPAPAPLADAEGVGRIVSGGFARRYLHSDPAPIAGARRPLLIVLHGGGGAAENVKRRNGFEAIAAREGLVVAYPDSQLDLAGAAERNWNDGRDVPQVRGNPEVDDVRFLTDLIDRYVASGTVDPRRIFLIGVSNGGMMSLRMACEVGERIAGIGIVIANLPVDAERRCRTRNPVPAVFVHGDADDTMPFGGGKIRSRPEIDRGAVVSAAATLEYWRTRNGCSGEPVARDIADSSSADGTTVRRFDWTECRGAPLRQFVVTGGGHHWPGLPVPAERIVRSGKTNADLSATREIWDFLSAATGGKR